LGETFLGGKVVRIATEDHADARGVLSPIDFAACGFCPVRAFVVSGPAGSVRGGHGHRTGRQILMLVSGLVDVEARAGDEAALIRLDPARRALLIEPAVWARQTYLGDNAALVVFCDTGFDPDDYILDPGGGGAAAPGPAR
jgi:dTDP-4-dehydrorhamnose 3,5-epimerase-like enzyme